MGFTTKDSRLSAVSWAGLIAAFALTAGIWVGEAWSATTVIYTWYRVGGESAGVIKLVKMADAWADPDNVTGVWSTADSAYKFTSDQENFAKIDFSSLYRIMEDAAAVLEYIDLGAKGTNDTLRSHRLAAAGVHGVTGTLVGNSDTQTLTNKTIDGDDNTVQDLAGSSIKTDAVLPQHSIRPDATKDTYAFFTSTADAVTIQASNAAKTDDDSLVVIAEKIRVGNDAGSSIKIAGLAAATANGEAVRYDEFAALESRVDDLERDDSFTPGATVVLYLSRESPSSLYVHASWGFTPSTDLDSVKQFDIFWSGSVLSGISAGATSAAELDYLRRNARRTTMGAGNWGLAAEMDMATRAEVWVCVVAYDWAGGAINTDIEYEVGAGNPRDGIATISMTYLRQVWGLYQMAEGEADSSADTLGTWLQSTTTERVKARGSFRVHAGDETFTLSFFAKAGAGANQNGYLRLAIYDGATEVESGTYLVAYAAGAYPATPMTLSVSVAALDAGQIYTFEVRTSSASTWAIELKQAMTAEIESVVTGQ